MKTAFAFLLLMLGFFESDQQCLTNDDNTPPHPRARSAIHTGQHRFSWDLLQVVSRLMPNENIFFSPYSTYQAFLLVYFISEGKTKKELENILRLDSTLSKISFYQGYRVDKLFTRLNQHESSYEFVTFNKLIYSGDLHIKSCFKSLFDDELLHLPFRADPEGPRKRINNSIKYETHNVTEDLLPPGSINTNGTLVLASAAYFKEKWENKFSLEETEPEIFYISLSKQTIVDMMHVEGTFNHGVSESLETLILEMPYKAEEISMYVFLPPFSKSNSVDDILKKLTANSLIKILNDSDLTAKTVQVSFPKFSIEQTIDLVSILQILGAQHLFSDNPNFSILTNDKNVSIGEGRHKAKIVVLEQGSQAEAATSLFDWRMIGSRDDNAVKFICNHPFIFVIYNKVTDIVLFTGVFRNPS